MKINAGRLEKRLNALAEFGRDETGGWTRFSYTSEYKKAQDTVRKWMEEAGMSVKIDVVGSLIGHLEGLDNSLPAIALGSHIDTVKNGGKFDGTIGVLGGLEVVQTIRENNIKHQHPIELIVFVEEEGGRFGAGLFGSQAMLGQITKDILLNKKDQNGISIYEALKEAGFDPEKVAEARIKPGYYKSYFELHIEQANVLETLRIPVGIVEGIAAPSWLKLMLYGRADHAGATPMHLRKDALTAASEIILAAEKTAKEVYEPTVATVGRINVRPGGINIVPGEVEMYIDVRDIYVANREKAINRIKAAVSEVCTKRGIGFSLEEIINIDPVVLPRHITDLIEEAAREVGVSYNRMISGAGHDAQLMAKITDVGMIFSPSKDGLSHCPDEWTDISDIAICTQVLLQTVLKCV